MVARSVRRPTLAATAVAAVLVLGSAQRIEPGAPRIFRSASGAWTLAVHPSDPLQAGGARCALTGNGEVRWERDLSFTFEVAAVSEGGRVAGCAYSAGPAGTGGAAEGWYHGDMILALLDPGGEVAWAEHEARRGVGFSHVPPVPSCTAVEFLDVANVPLFRVRDEDASAWGERWIVVDPRSGRRSSVRPALRVSDVPDVRAAAPFVLLRGRDVLLTAWRNAGGRTVAVQRADGDVVWRLPIPADEHGRLQLTDEGNGEFSVSLRRGLSDPTELYRGRVVIEESGHAHVVDR
jgi:hypothetical protein